MRLRFPRPARVGLVVALTACGQPAPPAGSFDYLFAPPGGRFQHVSSTDATGGDHDFVEIAAGGNPGAAHTPRARGGGGGGGRGGGRRPARPPPRAVATRGW